MGSYRGENNPSSPCTVISLGFYDRCITADALVVPILIFSFGIIARAEIKVLNSAATRLRLPTRRPYEIIVL